MKYINNPKFREAWLAQVLSELEPGSKILDVGAGECAHKQYCQHLNYVSQDVAEYDGAGNGAGLHTTEWDTSSIDIVCDLYDLEPDASYDVVLCSEVLEHVVDAAKGIEILCGLLKPGGKLILTAPFISLTHFAPHHHATGFSRYFYEHHLQKAGFEILEMTPNGGYFDVIRQEIKRVKVVHKQYKGRSAPLLHQFIFSLAGRLLLKYANNDGPRGQRESAELLTCGWHVQARKTT